MCWSDVIFRENLFQAVHIPAVVTQFAPASYFKVKKTKIKSIKRVFCIRLVVSFYKNIFLVEKR